MLRCKILIILFILVFFSLGQVFSQETNQTNTVPPADDPDTIFNNGLKELQKGNILKSISLLEKLLSHNTENPDYYIYLGYLYYRQFHYNKAVEVLNKSIEINDELLVSHILLGEIYYQMNKILKARNEFEKVNSINPKIKLAHNRLYHLFKDNNPSKANEHYLTIFQLPQTKLEKFLPDIDKVGNIRLPFNKSVLITKDIIIDTKIENDNKILDKILESSSHGSGNEEIIVSVKKSRFNLNLDFNFLLNPLKNFDKEKFYIKIIEFIFISIFLFIYSIFQKRKVKKLERIVLNQYRVSSIQEVE